VSAGNVTTISFYGTDTDGYVENYAYQWLSDMDWNLTSENTIVFNNLFSSQDDTLFFYVKSIDNQYLEDPTPAEVALTPQNALPETKITDGPGFAQTTGEDVSFSFSGTDMDAGGSVVKFEYTMDNLNSWHETPADFPRATFLGLTTGGHVFYVRAVDNLGGRDPSPAQVAFIVEGGKFAPELIFESFEYDKFGWFAGFPVYFSWSAITAHYNGMLPQAPYSYAIDESTHFDYNPVNPLISGWTGATSFKYIPDAGVHTFYIKIRDTAGGINLKSLTFTVASRTLNSGVLVVNGISPGDYGSAIADRIAASAY